MEKPTDENAQGSESKQGTSEDHQTLTGVKRNANIYLEGERTPGLVNESTAWDVYNNEARKVDSELVRDWSASLNFLLVFTAIFSAVLAAFIIESKRLLEQDPGEVMVDVMIFYTNSVANGTHTPYIRTNFVPTNAAVSINCLLFGSLSASLVAALASVIALQWVAEFDAAITRGGSSPQDRAKRRQFRFAGIEKWKMGGIIAALPLILYFSVVLFFAGLIQWMLLLHQTVGYVVITGAAVAGLFYSSSTIIAATFVSAPFKSPLSRWIYASQYLPAVITHGIVTTAHINEVPQWLTTHRKAYYTAHKREDLAVESSVDLAYQSMNWLARQLTVSEGYRRRLVLLMTELLEWPIQQLESPGFIEGPWVYILDFLASRHRNAVHISSQTREEELELAILIRCANLSVISTEISPNKQYYVSDAGANDYWSQYCITSKGSQFLPQRRHESFQPHVAFLVTRDLPVPSLNLRGDMHAALRLAKWRSSENKSLEDWKFIFSAADVLSQEFFDSSVCLLCSYARKNAPNWPNPTMKGVFVSIVSEIVKRAVVNGISSAALATLIRSFEYNLRDSKETVYSSPSVRSAVRNMDLDACVEHPISYARNLSYRGKRVQKLHCIMTLLATRNLLNTPRSTYGEAFKAVLLMLWLSPTQDCPRDWMQLERDYSHYNDSITRRGLDGEISQNWIAHVDNSSETTESICILFQIYSKSREIDDEWLVSCGRRSRSGLFLLFQLVDFLLHQDQPIVSRITILSSLCTALKEFGFWGPPLDPLNADSDFFPLGVVAKKPQFPYSVLKSPYLRSIAYREVGMRRLHDDVPECLSPRSLNPDIRDWSSDEFLLKQEAASFIFWDMSEEEPEWVWKLRAGFVSESFGHDFSIAEEILRESFTSPKQLSNLERIFAHPTSCRHYFGPGHMLYHVKPRERGQKFRILVQKTLFGVIPLDSGLPALYALLALSNVGELQYLELDGKADIDCVTRIWIHIDTIRRQQSAMFSFLLNLPLPHSNNLLVAGPGSVAVFLKAIEECMALTLEEASIPLLLPLSQRLLSIPYERFISGVRDNRIDALMKSPIVSEFGTKGANKPVGDQPADIGLDGEYIYGMQKENNAWDIYNNEARKVDNELVKDWTTSLNFLLVFAAIFSAVLAAFIIESKRLLEPDYNAMMVDVMIFYTNSVASGVRDIYTPAQFSPGNSAVSINCLLFGSLASSLVAALASVVSLQWVAVFDAAITRGGSSPEERAKRRQFRFAGVEKWKMGGIIAALPLLLYFSVLLFFIGVIQWMLLLNTTVGYIVMGGGLVVALFYFSSTIVGVFFVSSPFKTPLSQCVYAAYHLPSAIIYWIFTMASIQEKPQWVEERWRQYHTAHKREDLAVDSCLNLRYQAMHWLARQVSISENSRRRLLLLVDQLLEWPREQLESFELEETPWVNILNFLAQRHQGALQSQLQTREEEQEVALLVNCAALPGFNALILPTVKQDYDDNKDSDTYWSQHCITNGPSLAPLWRRLADLEEPTAIFLLIRDLPVPSLLVEDEMEITLRLAKWRNVENKPLGVWQIVFSTPRILSKQFFSSCIIMLSNYLTSHIHHQANMLAKGALGHVIHDITRKATIDGITSAALTALVRLFEVTLLQQDGIMVPYRRSKACLQGPLYYGRRLPGANEETLGIHRTLILLLAMDIDGLLDSEQPRRLQELRAMVWVTPSKGPSSHLQDSRWEDLMSKYGQAGDLADLDKEIADDWILYVDKSAELTEMIITLTETSPNSSQIGLRALSSCSKKSGKHMLALLRIFDNILCEDRQFDSAAIILKSLCKVLQTDEPGLLGKPPTPPDGDFSIYTFKTFYVRVIAHRALGVDRIEDRMMSLSFGWSELMDATISYMFWNMSTRDPLSVWQLRAWFMFAPSGHNLCELVTRLLWDAFRYPSVLVQVERILAERTLCHHPQGQGHLLNHLQSAIPPNILFRSDVRVFEAISLKKVKLPPITALLAISRIEELSFLGLPQQVDMACLSHLWNYLQSFKRSQYFMLEFLIELPLHYSPDAMWGSSAIVLKAMEDAIRLPPEDGSIPLLLPLSHRALRLSRVYVGLLSDQEEHKKQVEITTLNTHGRRIADLARARYSMVTVSGNRSLRLLSCSRPLWGTRPASGWWLSYD